MKVDLKNNYVGYLSRLIKDLYELLDNKYFKKLAE
jgi:hypothetical protein